LIIPIRFIYLGEKYDSEPWRDQCSDVTAEEAAANPSINYPYLILSGLSLAIFCALTSLGFVVSCDQKEEELASIYEILLN